MSKTSKSFASNQDGDQDQVPTVAIPKRKRGLLFSLLGVIVLFIIGFAFWYFSIASLPVSISEEDIIGSYSGVVNMENGTQHAISLQLSEPNTLAHRISFDYELMITDESTKKLQGKGRYEKKNDLFELTKAKYILTQGKFIKKYINDISLISIESVEAGRWKLTKLAK